MFLEKKLYHRALNLKTLQTVFWIYSLHSVYLHILLFPHWYMPQKNMKQNETTQSQSNINFGLVQLMSSSTLFIYESLYAI